MYAIVDIAGQQFKVEKDQKIYVHRIEGEEGAKVEFDQVLLIDDDGKVNVGAPVVDGALISGKIITHLKGDKVQIFKKKRRKGYQTLNGHRQQLTELLIEDIAASGKKKAADKKEEKPKTEAKAEKKAEPKKQATAKKEEAPQTEEKKETKAAKPKTEAKKAKPAAEKKETKAAAKDEPKKSTTKKAAPKAEKKDDNKEEK